VPECLLWFGLLSGLTTCHAQYEMARLDEVLSVWEKQSLRCLSIEAELTTKDRVFKKEETQVCLFKYRRLEDGRLAVFIARRPTSSSTKKEEQTNWTPVLLYDGKALWFFDETFKVIRGGPCEGKTPRIKFLWILLPPDFFYYPFFFYLRCNPNELQQRFNLTVFREDQGRVWIRAIPKTSEEQKEFLIAQVGVLMSKGYSVPEYFPQIITWRDYAKDYTYFVKQVSRNDVQKVQESDFNLDAHSAGWKVEKVK